MCVCACVSSHKHIYKGYLSLYIYIYIYNPSIRPQTGYIYIYNIYIHTKIINMQNLRFSTKTTFAKMATWKWLSFNGKVLGNASQTMLETVKYIEDRVNTMT